MAISDIFAEKGETYFRDAETALLKDLTEKKGIIISCGGGAVMRDENAALMKQCGKIVLLTATPETIYERVKDSTDRPILNGNMNVDYIRELMEKRKDRYLAVADVVVATDQKSAEEITREILAAFA
jgi:chorismate mutase